VLNSGSASSSIVVLLSLVFSPALAAAQKNMSVVEA
jgi:hypothetical protein